MAIVGVARAAGVDAGVATGTAGSGWETASPTPEVQAPVVAELGDVLPGATAQGELSLGEASPGEPSPGEPSPGDASPGGAMSRDGASPDWWSVLAELDALRVRALAEADPARLPTYAQPGSPAWKQDAALLADLSGQGLRPRGLTARVLAVERIDHDGDVAQLQVVDERTGYSIVDSQGSVVQDVEPAGPRRWAVTLSRWAPITTGPEPVDPTGDPGWRVATVVPVPAGQSTAIDEGDEGSNDTDDARAGGAP